MSLGSAVKVDCKFVRHDTVESLVDEYFKDDYQNEEGRYEGFVSGGDETQSFALSKAEILTAVHNQGKWAFALTDEKVIHYWYDPARVSPASLAFLLGHEVGHLTGTAVDDDWEEEVRADTYGSAVITVLDYLVSMPK